MKIGPIYINNDSIEVGSPGEDRLYLSLHVDHPWSECVQEFNAPARIYFNSPLGLLTIGLPSTRSWSFSTEGAKRVRVPLHIARSQTWKPFQGSTTEWRWIAFHPSKELLCQKQIGGPKVGRSGTIRYSTCGKLRWHPGECRIPNALWGEVNG